MKIKRIVFVCFAFLIGCRLIDAPTDTAVPTGSTATTESELPFAPAQQEAPDVIPENDSGMGSGAATAAALTSPTAQAIVVVSSGKTPTIDGILSPNEWIDAEIMFLSDGSELLLMKDTDYLYLGVRSTTKEMIGANIFIEDNGRIMILHASAALGTAVYQQGPHSWQQTQNFDWHCRDTGNSESAQAERTAYLQENHWLAANSRMGTPNELEYQIELADAPQPIAVTVFRSSTPNERVFWPTTLDDDTIQPNPGGLPTEMHFSPNLWAFMDMQAADTGYSKQPGS